MLCITPHAGAWIETLLTVYLAFPTVQMSVQQHKHAILAYGKSVNAFRALDNGHGKPLSCKRSLAAWARCVKKAFVRPVNYDLPGLFPGPGFDSLLKLFVRHWNLL
jgi:hypothetical protein